MAQLHFQPIQGKSLDIIDAILHTAELASVGDFSSRLSVVVEEIVLNIVDYSTSDYLDVEILRDGATLTLRFHDGGVPFNPLEREFPDFTLPLEDRPIGGLGIFMTKQIMDDLSYARKNGRNILTMRKALR